MADPLRYISRHMKMAEYQAEKSVSASMITAIINECPLRAWTDSPFNSDFVPEEPKTEFDIGTALHIAAMEPEQFSARVAIINCDNYKRAAARNERDAARAAGLTPIKVSEYDIVVGMRDALRRHPVASKLIEGEIETSLFWDWDGTPCKCRPDVLIGRGETIVDLKTAISANPRKIAAKAWNESWQIRDAWYREGVRACLGTEPKHYVYLVVEKNPPHIIQPYELDSSAIMWSGLAIRYGIERFKACIASGEWPSYGEGIAELSLPSFADFQMAEREQEWQE